MAPLSQQLVEGLQAFPHDSSSLTGGRYTIQSTEAVDVTADDHNIQTKVWFKSPPLKGDTIDRIRSVQLFAESHDQGWADNESAGNWTWLELAIFENESSTTARIKDGIELVWTSHYNHFLTETFDWKEGDVFGKDHELFRLLEDGNIIAIRICARFGEWAIFARTGYLIVDISPDTVDRRGEPPKYAQVVSDVKGIEKTLSEVNERIGAAFKPAIPDNFFRADVFSTGGKRPLRILSLDGGGIRGLASLHVLNAIMKKMDPTKKPCEVFDIIGGTSTGGWIAIMLGCLQMTVDECIQVYMEFKDKMFKAGEYGPKKDHKYNEEVVKTLFMDLIAARGLDPEAKMFDEKNACKVFVMAVRQDAANNRGPVFLRSYVNPLERSLLPEVKLWEAARATGAAPGFWASIKVGDYTLVDGGLGAMNPLGWLWTEVSSVFGPARPATCFLSIGTGIPSNKEVMFDKNPSFKYEDELVSVIINAELIHILFRTLIDAYAPVPLVRKYWRFNVNEKTPDGDYKSIGEIDDVNFVPDLKRMTEKYIGIQEDSINECAKALESDA